MRLLILRYNKVIVIRTLKISITLKYYIRGSHSPLFIIFHFSIGPCRMLLKEKTCCLLSLMVKRSKLQLLGYIPKQCKLLRTLYIASQYDFA